MARRSPRWTPPAEAALPPRASGWRGLVRWTVLWSLAPWVLGDFHLLGYGLTGWAWTMGGVVAAAILALRSDRVRGRWIWWAPWLGVLVIGWVRSVGHPAAAQTVLQTACPIVVGMAASTFRATSADLAWLMGWLRWMPGILWALAASRFPDLLQGRLLQHGWLTPEMCGVALWASFYVGVASAGDRRFLWHFASLVVLPVVFFVRGPTAAALLSLPLTPAPIGLGRRLVVVALAGAAAVAVLSSERFQARMFHSGRGTLADLRLDNPDLSTTGRTAMWAVLIQRAEEAPLLGHGVNASRTELAQAGFGHTHPHNDWLKLWHDVGVLGVLAFVVGVAATVRALVRPTVDPRSTEQGLRWAAATGFVPLLLLMATDNVILYSQYMGNVHFALLGGLLGRRP